MCCIDDLFTGVVAWLVLVSNAIEKLERFLAYKVKNTCKEGI
jgi:hypothetical protein